MLSENGASTVTVSRAEGDKGQRYWKYLPLGTDHEHPTLCESCAGIVREMESKR